MSGGHFDYNQYYISNIANEIENIFRKIGKKRNENELKDYLRYINETIPEYLEKYPEDAYYYPEFDKEIIKTEFANAIYTLRKAAIYAQRIDWLLSGDDGVEDFIERLNEELEQLKRQSL